MKNASLLSERAMHYVALAALLAASLLPALIPQNVEAAQITSRSIQLSDSTVSATGVTYTVGFTPASNASSLEVLFCQEDPIDDATCTAPTGLDVNSGSLGTTSGLGGAPTKATSTGNNTFAVDGTLTASSALTFEITGATNGSSNGTFYARITTYDATGGEDGAGADVDFGGIALSLANQVSVTAKVHETLTFSVTTLNGGDNQIALGDANGVLNDPGTVYNSTGDNAEFTLATNAQSGAIVRLSGDTLVDGANNIDAGGALAAFTGSAATEEFGLHVDTTGSTNITADADYDGSGGNYALVNTGGGQDDITQAGGAQIANTAGPTDTDTAEVEFAAQASNTTPAGVYTGTYTFIATGTF